ncbi:polysaccharide deacetylase family protein [Sphingomonas sp.]|uniref:polysaccharide deacetylase family protein n=1 Tax=Sphingomonas sp. TaxID=28214 RepID=UPI0025F4B940|nr:polysaccharide deacetylase family protein [Sphingomonas sp.]
MTRRGVTVSTAVGIVILVFALGLFRISRALCFQLIGTPICHVDTREKLVALTFDDGPTPDGVSYILSTLKPYDAHATFFLIGQEMVRHPGEVRRLLAAGQEVGNHSYSHKRMWGLFPGDYVEEIRRTDGLLRDEGARPDLFRPPFGKKLTGLPIAVEQTGYRMVTWDVTDPEDAHDSRRYADRVLDKVKPGSIILIHAMYRSRGVARGALPLILAGLRDRGYRAVSVSELLHHRAPGMASGSVGG